MGTTRDLKFGSVALTAATVLFLAGAASLQAQDTIRPRAEEGTEAAEAAAELSAAESVPMVLSPTEPWNELRTYDPVPDETEGGVAVGGDRISILVHMEPRLDRVERPRVKALAARENAFVKYEYEVLPNVMNIRNFPRNALGALKAHPGVVRVEEDYIVTLQHNDSMPLIRALQSQITGAGHSATGAGVRVCVVDTGIDSNSIMYSSRIDAAAGWDFVNNDSNPEDDQGHGSHVAGTVLGGANVTADFPCATTGPEPMQGVAPGATLIGVKVLNASGSGSASNIIAGINRCASTTLPGGQADVINLSLGGGQFSSACDSDTMAAAANNAVNAGVVVVAAAGNSGYTNALSTPACGSNVIAVGAIYDDNFPNCDFPSQTSFSFCLDSFCFSTCTDNNPVVNQRVCFSNRSPMLDVAAPGCLIFSDDSTVAGGNGLVGFCGTSQAAPHVAGLAALLLDVDPTLTPAEVHQIIRDGAVDLGTAGFDSNFGYGRIDVINSLDLAAPPAGCTSHTECDDGLFCNGAEQCVSNSCQAGSAPNCSDSVACTTDSCNESTDSCDHAPNNAACDDGLFCNGSETCNATLGCQGGSDPCGGQPCNEGTDSCGAGEEVWLTFTTTTAVPGLGNVENEDIVAYNTGTGTWSLIFDGSDVGLSGFIIDGVARLPSGEILYSVDAAGTITGLVGGPSGGSVDDSDIIRFTPTTLGTTTAGTHNFYFDGSDVGLTANDEDVDAISLTSTGGLVLSTLGAFGVTGVSGQDEDLFVFTATSLGSVTAGSFAMYFDGSDVGLSTNNSEDVDAAGITSAGTILFSTLGAFSVTGASGTDEDIFEFAPTSLGETTAGSFTFTLDLSSLGISGTENVNAVELVE